MVATGWLRRIGSLIVIVPFPQKNPSISTVIGHEPLICSKIITGWLRRLGSLIVIRPFPQKNPSISGSFAENDLRLKASYGTFANLDLVQGG